MSSCGLVALVSVSVVADESFLVTLFSFTFEAKVVCALALKPTAKRLNIKIDPVSFVNFLSMSGEVKLNFGSKVRSVYYLNVKTGLTFSNIPTTLTSEKLNIDLFYFL